MCRAAKPTASSSWASGFIRSAPGSPCGFHKAYSAIYDTASVWTLERRREVKAASGFAPPRKGGPHNASALLPSFRVLLASGCYWAARARICSAVKAAP